MDRSTLILVILCSAALALAGCTAPAPDSVPVTTVPATPAATAPTPMNAMGCVEYSDCVPAQCCHPTSCINRVAQKDCSGTSCTMSCEGPLDCGAGTCGCVEGRCTVIPAQAAAAVAATTPLPTASSPVRIWATPNRYSPIISSTPGLELSVITPQGTDASTVVYDWTASYGTFLAWNPPDYAVHEKGSKVTTNGGKIYWSFHERPSSTASPVVITMTMRDTATRKELGRSVLTLDWDGDNAVMVKEIS